MAELLLMSFKVCLQCGRKTLVYYNSLCRTCLLKMKLQAIVKSRDLQTAFHQRIKNVVQLDNGRFKIEFE